MVVKRNDTGTESTLVLEGSVRIGEAEALKAVLVEALDSTQPLITLDLAGVEDVDLTLFQACLALQAALSDQGRHLILRSLPAEHVVMETAKLLGLPLAHHFTQVEAAR